MARIRTIKPELLKDEKTATLNNGEWRLFVSLIVLADDYGNLRAAPRQIGAEAFWGTDEVVDIQAALVRFQALGLLRLYNVRGQAYAHLCGWTKHQKVDKPGKPLCPSPEEAESTESTGEIAIRETVANPSRDVRETPAPDLDLEEDRDRDREQTRAVARTRPTSNLFDATLKEFAADWSAQYGSAYVPTPADRSQLGRLLSKLAPAEAAELPTLYRRYLADNDTFVAEKQRHSIAFFCTSGGMNKYRTEPKAAGASQRDLGNAAALAKFGQLAFGGKR